LNCFGENWRSQRATPPSEATQRATWITTSAFGYCARKSLNCQGDDLEIREGTVVTISTLVFVAAGQISLALTFALGVAVGIALTKKDAE
jgi:hypothetical protein